MVLPLQLLDGFPRCVALKLIVFILLAACSTQPTTPSVLPPTATIDPVIPVADPITFVPFPHDSGFGSIVPQGWRDAGNGAFGYAQSDVAIVQRTIPAPAISFVQPGIERDMQLINPSDDYTAIESNGLEWQVYRGENADFSVDYALADGGALTVYLVLMQVHPDDGERLYEELFLPTLEAFRPS